MDDVDYVFGSFRLHPARRLLLGNDRPLQLGSRALDILTILVERAGETVSNEQIMARAWPRTMVEEGSLRVHIGALRKTLGDGRGVDRFIVNIPGRGYSFVAPVKRGQGEAPPPLAQATPAGAAPVASSLPRPLVSIIGRGDTITAVAGQLARRRLLTIVGPGGIGKTTVAIAAAESVAASYPDGVWFVALASLPTSDLVSSAIAAAFGVAASGFDPLRGLASLLRDKQALIVLDNCEHVVDGVAAVTEELLKAAQRIGILATSREPLRCAGEFRRFMMGSPPVKRLTTPRCSYSTNAHEHPMTGIHSPTPKP
jgi:DNA-binding winged helix-turn-helix (wHTH) protein